jgi:hypothetical protein
VPLPDGNKFKYGQQPHICVVMFHALRWNRFSFWKKETEKMLAQKVIIKFEQVAEQSQGLVKRIVGFVQARHLLGLFDATDLEANPRSAKAGANSVTTDIRESIENSPSIFPFKTKGVLVGTSKYIPLQRNRYELRFEQPDIEGILDGGHNMLAIGTEILSNVVSDDRELARVRLWADFRAAWTKYRSEVDQIREYLDFVVPLEILVPANPDDEDNVEEFLTSLLDICAARNNNVELTREARAHKRGFYDRIQALLPEEVRKKIEWKTNDGGIIKVRDVIALAWIPLSLLDLPNNLRVSPQNIYRNKGECARVFDELMSHDSVSKRQEGTSLHELVNPAIESAFEILSVLPELYDKIYLDFPSAYNESGGSFGKINIVKIFDPEKANDGNQKYIRSQPFSHFTSKPTKFRYPDGLIMPLVYGLKALMKRRNGRLEWIVDPEKFLDQHFPEIVDAYRLVLEMSRFDPQKLGKNETSYKIAVSEFEKALMKSQHMN